MSISGALVVFGTKEIKLSKNVAWTETEVFTDDFSEITVSHSFSDGSVRVDVERQRFLDADSVGELDQYPFAESCSHQRLGHPSSGLSSTSVHLARIFSRKGPSTVGPMTALGVHYDFPTCQTRVSMRPSDRERTRGVHYPLDVVIKQVGGQYPFADGDQFGCHLFVGFIRGVLVGNKDSVNPDWFEASVIILLLNGNL